MGYSTEFKGELKFKTEMTATQLSKVKAFLGEDCRNHPEWGRSDLTYIDLQLTDDFSGLQWDGSEKTYDIVDKVNLVIQQMQLLYPEFGLEGQLLAQGEDMNDRWMLQMKDGLAVNEAIVVTETKITCPHCGESFVLEQ